MPNVPRNSHGRFSKRASRPSPSKTRKSSRPSSQPSSAPQQRVGSRAQVVHGTAHHTSGGLEKKDLLVNKHGRIVSRRKHASGSKSLKHLTNAGYIAKKGEFVAMQKH
jgi:hypothetical protein